MDKQNKDIVYKYVVEMVEDVKEENNYDEASIVDVVAVVENGVLVPAFVVEFWQDDRMSRHNILTIPDKPFDLKQLTDTILAYKKL